MRSPMFLPAYNLLPGLVVRTLGFNGIVTHVRRESDEFKSYVHVEVNLPVGNVVYDVTDDAPFAVVGTSWNLRPDHIEEFEVRD